MSKLEGFKDGLKALGIEKVKLDVYLGENNLKKLEAEALKMLSKIDEYDLIAVGGSLEAYYIKRLKPNVEKPIVIMGGTAIKT